MADLPMTLKQAITLHFMTYWGVPREIDVQEQPRLDLAVLEFGPRAAFDPRKERQTYRFATVGMSECVQLHCGKGHRTELYASARSSARWIVKFLTAAAEYPRLHKEAFVEFDTLPVADPTDAFPFGGLLIAPPGPDDDETVGAVIGVTPEPLLVHEIIGITDRELDFGIEHGGEALWNRLRGLGCPLLLDEKRPQAFP
jgi:hypothetical protein